MTGKKYNNKNHENAQGKKVEGLHSDQIKITKRIHFEQIDSTNTWAKMNVDQWAPEGVTLITASGQTAGRGRFRRRWESPFGVNVYATFCFWFDIHRTDIGHIPQLLSLAAALTLEREGFFPLIKWPNDLLIKGKKMGGILCETVSEQMRRGIICGIGLNINMPVDALKLIDRPATSLLAEKGREFDQIIILENLQHHFITFLGEFTHKGFSPFFPLLQERSAFKKGEWVRFHDNQTLLEGQFETIHPDGSVELRLANGILKIFYAGEFLT